MKMLFTPTRMAQMKKTLNTKCWRGCGSTGALITAGEGVMGTASSESSSVLPTKDRVAMSFVIQTGLLWRRKESWLSGSTGIDQDYPGTYG